MITTLFDAIREIAEHINDPIAEEFLRRAGEGALTRDENPQTHFCVYFAAYTHANREDFEVFIGHHKKSDVWLFNGGHIDKGELPVEAVAREIGEEWGLAFSPDEVGKPELLTIKEINNPSKQTCTRHYDIWYFIRVDKNAVEFDRQKLAKEFHEARWMTLEQADALVTDPATVKALGYLASKFS
jgi:8-oxo-dGTP pyrophosphatase MutT (NUDIX family)